MASEKSNGHDRVTADMMALLQQIAGQVGETRTELRTGLGQMRAEVAVLRGDFEVFRDETRENQRLMRAILEKHQDGIEALTLDVRELRGDLDKGLDEVRGEVRELRTGLDEVRGEVRELRTGLDEVRGEVREVRTGLGEVRGEVREVRDDVTALRGELRARAILGD
jgi:predicted nuclease with TOPRIM domain